MFSAIGFLGRKCGMTTFFAQDGSHIPATLVYVGKNFILDVKTQAKHGYNALVIGTDEVRPKIVNKPQRVWFEKIGVNPLREVVEFRVNTEADLSKVKCGVELPVNLENLFNALIDVRSISKGKGFAGVVKRYGFGGQLGSHGESLSERSHGATGQRQDPGKVFKGKKMAGHMGSTINYVNNLRVLQVLPEDGLLVIKGSIPGCVGSLVEVFNPVKSVNSRELVSMFNGVNLLVA